ncbi:MAG: 4Fe-4S binding protein [Planctomycetes bacterium]|nr:4Fe-4S binding protein [Planctomycetota bacterium]
MNLVPPSAAGAAAPSPACPPRRGYGRLRAACLIGVHVLFGVHIAHWAIAGETLAPLELNEVMYTFELGVVTAGFLLMATAALATLIFGRFFCAWLCHIVALQDLCAALLRKFGLRPKPIRSRVLRLVPFVALAYMFVWPQVMRLWSGRPLPTLHFQSTTEPWASFVTENFWRNLPGPWIAGLTFLICGFAIVYMLGSRAFCANACPYGAVFGLASRVSPGQLLLRGNCTNCGQCTAVCTSGVWVHQEVQTFGKIVDPNCLRDLDCVAACPEQAIGFGFARPAGFSSWRRAGRKPRPFHTSWREEGLIAVMFLAAVLIFRGLYDAVPFLMTLGIGGILAYMAVLGLRLMRGEHASIRGHSLRHQGRWTRHGRYFALAAALLTALTLNSACVRYHEYTGGRAFEDVRAAVERRDTDLMRRSLPVALAHFEACERWGMIRSIDLDRRLASLYRYSPTPDAAEPHLRRVLAYEPEDAGARLSLVYLLAHLERGDEAARELAVIERTADEAMRDEVDKARAVLQRGR